MKRFASRFYMTFACAMFVLGCGGCGESNKNEISGVSQKGPFVNGSPVTIQELNSLLEQTGNSFKGKIRNDRGEFSVASVGIASPFVFLEVNGYYFNEVRGRDSESTISLNALADVSDRQNVNINLLTHLETNRVMHLVSSENINFADAKKQARNEIFNAFGFSGNFGKAEDMNIFGKGDDAAALLAMSLIVQGDLSESEFTKRLSDISNDFEDGVINDRDTWHEMALWALWKNTEYLRQNMETLGETIPNFEKYLKVFWTKELDLEHCDNVGEIIEYEQIQLICRADGWDRAERSDILGTCEDVGKVVKYKIGIDEYQFFECDANGEWQEVRRENYENYCIRAAGIKSSGIENCLNSLKEVTYDGCFVEDTVWVDVSTLNIPDGCSDFIDRVFGWWGYGTVIGKIWGGIDLLTVYETDWAASDCPRIANYSFGACSMSNEGEIKSFDEGAEVESMLCGSTFRCKQRWEPYYRIPECLGTCSDANIGEKKRCGGKLYSSEAFGDGYNVGYTITSTDFYVCTMQNGKYDWENNNYCSTGEDGQTRIVRNDAYICKANYFSGYSFDYTGYHSDEFTLYMLDKLDLTEVFGVCNKDNYGETNSYEFDEVEMGQSRTGYYMCFGNDSDGYRWNKINYESYMLGVCDRENNGEAKEIEKMGIYVCLSNEYYNHFECDESMGLGICGDGNEIDKVKEVSCGERVNYYICLEDYKGARRWKVANDMEISDYLGTCSTEGTIQNKGYGECGFICRDSKWVVASISECILDELGVCDYEGDIKSYNEQQMLCQDGEWHYSSIDINKACDGFDNIKIRYDGVCFECRNKRWQHTACD